MVAGQGRCSGTVVESFRQRQRLLSSSQDLFDSGARSGRNLGAPQGPKAANGTTDVYPAHDESAPSNHRFWCQSSSGRTDDLSQAQFATQVDRACTPAGAFPRLRKLQIGYDVAMSNVEAMPSRSSEAEYLAFELATTDRHELIEGVIVAMAGASKRHNVVAGNLFTILRSVAAPQGCATYLEGVRLKISEDTHVYPDVMVVCEDNGDDYEVTSPCLVAEVLSPSTAWVDHGRKRIACLQMSSLLDYLLLNTVENVIERYHRTSNESPFTYAIYHSGETINLDCPPGSVTVDSIFAT
jgi:Uma2 family endonuclease